MTAAQISDLHARGHAVGSHSCSHPTRMALCTPAQLKHEWMESGRVLSDILNSPVRIASVPGGYYLKSVAYEAAAAGIEVLFNSEPITHPQRVSGCLVVGRFSIRQGVSSDSAARIAGGDFLRCTQQYLYWNAEKLAKRLGGDYYLSLRKAALKRAA
jgi:peptidoglycan/xylan/chitin deacetylase (PgdA/CDA1 family)